MERLTEHHVNKSLGAYMVCSGACIDDDFDCNNCEKLAEIINRLAAYEDTMTLERAQDLAQAEKDGRLVVLPCKVGDTVYITYGEGYITCVVDRMHIIANNQVQVRMRNFIIETLWLSVSEFGETVFLTREEAEAALKKREEAGNEAD